MSLDLFLQILVLMESAIIVCLAEPAINRMSPCTGIFPRMAFHLLTVGAVFRLYAISTGDIPSLSTAISTGGIALLLLCDRCLSGETGRNDQVRFSKEQSK